MNTIYKSAGKLRQLRGTQAGANRFRASLIVVGYGLAVGSGLMLAFTSRFQVAEKEIPHGPILGDLMWNIENREVTQLHDPKAI